jgi:hypothetical protein
MITFEHRVPETSTDVVFRMVVEWLGSQKAKIKQSRPPSFIEASHGRSLQPMGWKKDAKKTIIFNISQQGNDVLVKVDLTPGSLNASDVRSRIDQARANWNELMSDLWYVLGDLQAPKQATANPPVIWQLSLRRAKRTLYSGVIITGVGILANIILAPTVGVILISLIVVGVLAMINGGMNVRSAKKGIARQTQTPA